MGTPRLPRSYNIIYRFRQGRCYAGNVIVSTLQLARPTHAKNQNAGTFPNQKKKKLFVRLPYHAPTHKDASL